MKPIKICIISLRSLPLFDSAYNTENVIGGAEINLFNLACCLSQKKNLSVQVLVDDFGQPERYKKGGIELIRFKKNSSDKPWLVRKFNAIKAYRALLLLDADVFIFTASSELLGVLVLFQRILRRKQVFFRLSSDLNIDLNNFKRNNSYISYLLYQFGLKNSTKLISQTMKQKNLLKTKLGLDSEIIENGFFMRSGIRAEDKEFILWVGRCMDTKHPMKFIELAQKLPEKEFVMIMPINKEIPEAEKEHRQELAHNVNEAAKSLKNLKLIDYVPFHRIQDYFDKAKAYVCTSELEGFPNTFIQACLGGTPIISYCINPSNMIEEYDLGCFCHNDSERAVNFIKDLDSKKSNKFIDNLQKYVALKHNIYDTAENYLNLMKEGAGYARRAGIL
ncbi:MAG: glycosyltransferase [Acetivibrionales bacterium]|jgi:glycosyltransferase involved in cell wall biosynthesis